MLSLAIYIRHNPTILDYDTIPVNCWDHSPLVLLVKGA